MVRNTAVEAENKIITIKLEVKPANRIRHTKTFMGVIGGNPSTQISGLGGSFQSDEINSMVAKPMEEHALASVEAAYDCSGGQESIGFMTSGGGYHYVNASGGTKNTPHLPTTPCSAK